MRRCCPPASCRCPCRRAIWQSAVDGVAATQRTDQALRELRRLRVRELLRVNRQAARDRSARSADLRNEVVALSPTPAALEQARAQGFTVGRTRTLEGLDVTIVVLQAPAGMSTRRALRTLRDRDPSGAYDFNHVYTESGDVPPGRVSATPPTTAAVAAGGRAKASV